MARAFTLIELLIVVAIIAILAAIAVPNFLEAQVRSKVASAYNDLRQYKTALEAYRVDNTAYPPDAGGYNENVDWAMLTTPVAYLTSVLYSPFDARNYQHFSRGIRSPYFYGVPGEGTPVRAAGIFYVIGCSGPDLDDDWSQIGPDWIALDNGTGSLEVLYDPTNGVRSSGDLIATNKGIYNIR
jgi:type II secretion system protein G